MDFCIRIWTISASFLLRSVLFFFVFALFFLFLSRPPSKTSDKKFGQSVMSNKLTCSAFEINLILFLLLSHHSIRVLEIPFSCMRVVI